MQLIIVNNSDDSYSFVNDIIVVDPNSSTSISSDYWFNLFDDLNFLANIRNNNLLLNDGVLLSGFRKICSKINR